MLPANMIVMYEIHEEEERNARLRFNIERHLMRSESDPFTLEDTHFKNLYRLSKDMVNYLIQQLAVHMTTSLYYRAIEPQLRIFAALYFYATGSYQRVVGQSYQLSMAQNTVCKAVQEVTALIVQHLGNEWIVFPQNIMAKTQIKNSFMENTRFPGVVGAIDCTHVAILKPTTEEHNYFNRKGYHSKNVQIICDYNLRILNINARYGGATHDSYIWRQSVIREEMEQRYNEGDTVSWLIGDSGYPQQPWLMTPVLNAAVGSPEERYNERHASARNCVERCNGVLKSRFRCVMGERTLRYNPVKAAEIIMACAVLHNICVAGHLDVPNIEYDNAVVNDIAQDEIVENHQGAESRRALIARYFQ